MKKTVGLLSVVIIVGLVSLACLGLAGIRDGKNAALPLMPTQVIQVVQPTLAQFASGATQESAALPQVNVLDSLSEQDTLIQLYKKINPGVVSVRVSTQDGGGLGSGFVLDKQGHVVTNYHVVEGVQDLEVGFASGFKAHGEVISQDLDSDLAIIAVDAPAEELVPLPLGDSDKVQVGQTVIAIGNPFGLEGTMTIGIISGLGRTLSSFHDTGEGGTFSAGDIIQTDAAINPGNSGGPLLNLDGEVIGINEAIRTTNYSTSGEPVNSGIGFAISVNVMKRVTPDLIASGKYAYPYLGITSIDELTLKMSEALGLSRPTGVYITGVTAGGPADKAGIRAGSNPTDDPNLLSGGDLIVAIDQVPVRTYNDLISYLVENKSPGDKVTLTVLRDGDQLQLEAVLDKRPDN